jgi:hypothetical protein
VRAGSVTARVSRELAARPDLAISLALAVVLLSASLMYLPGHAGLLAWRSFDNPILYADRFAFPALFPNDRIVSHLRDLYPYLSIVHLAPALLLKYLAVPPQFVTFVEVAVNDPLIVLAMYWLCRALGMDRTTSVLAGLFTISSRVLSWNLAGYEYLGHDFPYSGSLYPPFALAVIPALIHGRVRLALLFAGATACVFAPAGALMLGVILVFLVIAGNRDAWRTAVPWLAVPLLALAWIAVVQLIITGTITERFTPAEDFEVVMVNGHFVPLWISGQPFASPYLGFFMWCGLCALAIRQWRGFSARQRLPITILAALIVLGVLAGLVAVQQGSLFVLRLGPFRYTLLLGLAGVPFVVGYLTEKMRTATTPIRMAALVLFVLLVVDRGTAWMLPLMLPYVLVLALGEPNHRVARGAVWAVLVVSTFGAVDVLLHLGVAEGVAEWVGEYAGPTARVAGLLSEASRRLHDGGRELFLLPLVGLIGLMLWLRPRVSAARGDGGSLVVHGLCVFLFACLVGRTAVTAIWAATGVPAKMADAQRWARTATPVAAKFVFFELEPDGNYPSWQTLSQRGAAEMQYTQQKVYLPDRQLLAIDRAVSANYGFDPEDVDAKMYPFYALELQGRYRQFTAGDFLRAAHRSGSNFIVLRAPRALDFPVAYANEMFTVYRVPARFQDVVLTATRIGGGAITIAWDGGHADRPARRLFVEFRDARNGRVVGTSCCVTIGAPAGERTFAAPGGASGPHLALVGVTDADTGRPLTLDGDATGENLGFWEYLVAN